MNRPLKKLFDLEIDEVSVVDRPANQHGLISFSKAADDYEDGEHMDLFDIEGDAVDVDGLEHGDVVIDSEGNEYVFVEEEEEFVGKASPLGSTTSIGGAFAPQYLPTGESAYMAAPSNKSQKKMWKDYEKSGRKVQAKYDKKVQGAIDHNLGKQKLYAETNPDKAAKFGSRAAALGHVAEEPKAGFLSGAGKFLKTPGGKVAAGAGAAAAAFGIGAALNKSFGDEFLEELSKAVTSEDRDYIVAKAMDEVEIAKAAAAEAWQYAAAIEDRRIEEAYISKAAEYNLPVAPEVLGPILKSISTVLSDEELDILDQIFEAVGDLVFDEVGYVGDTDNVSVMDMIDYGAEELVGKADVSRAEAVTALLEANPSAYEAYLAENGRY